MEQNQALNMCNVRLGSIDRWVMKQKETAAQKDKEKPP